jgi:hypothetical protein
MLLLYIQHLSTHVIDAVKLIVKESLSYMLLCFPTVFRPILYACVLTTIQYIYGHACMYQNYFGFSKHHALLFLQTCSCSMGKIPMNVRQTLQFCLILRNSEMTIFACILFSYLGELNLL